MEKRLRLVVIVGLLLALTLFLVSCAPSVAPTPAPQMPALVEVPAPSTAKVAAPVRPAWEEKWERTVEAASQEGRIVLSFGGGTSLRSALMQGFTKTFGIQTEVIAARGSEMAVKIAAERRAGIHSFDIHMGGATTPIINLKPIGALAPLEPAFILPELTDPELIKKTWFEGELSWIDSDHTVIRSVTFPNYAMAINTDLVKEGDIKSYRDLLLSKWKGKIILNDPSIAGQGSNFVIFVEQVLGWDYLVELANTKPLVLTDRRVMMEWVAHGKAAILIPPNPDVLFDFIKAGAPVRGLTPKEGTWLQIGAGGLSMFRDAPHPNAAKLFVNWILGKEGNTVFSQAGGYQSARLDVPTGHLLPGFIREANVKYAKNDDEKLLLGQPERLKKTTTLLKSLGLIK